MFRKLALAIVIGAALAIVAALVMAGTMVIAL